MRCCARERTLNEKDYNVCRLCRCTDRKGGLLDDVLQDAGWAAVFAGWVCEARRGRIRDDQGRADHGHRIQDAGMVHEDARRSAGDAMNERHLYRGLNNFEGSIDEEGKLYDERHRLVWRIEGNDVYDYCNIKQGTIDESGKLWDCNRNYVGEAHGNNFIGPN